MGQPIEVTEPTVLESVAVFDTDRTLSGQDGESFAPGAASGDTFPAELARRVFSEDSQADHLHVFSNTVSIRRSGGWDEAALSATHRLITDFFVFYDENKSA